MMDFLWELEEAWFALWAYAYHHPYRFAAILLLGSILCFALGFLWETHKHR